MDNEQKLLVFVSVLSALAGGAFMYLAMDYKNSSLECENLKLRMQNEMMYRWIEAQPDPES